MKLLESLLGMRPPMGSNTFEQACNTVASEIVQQLQGMLRAAQQDHDHIEMDEDVVQSNIDAASERIKERVMYLLHQGGQR